MSKPTELILPANQWIVYNNCKIHWFIGDGIGTWKFAPDNWHAWGCYYDKNKKPYPYRMYGQFNSKTRMLSKIKVLPKTEGSEIYFDQNIYDLLTK